MATMEAPPLARLGVRPRPRDYIRSLWDRRQFALAIPSAELQAQHRNTALGGVWHLIDPLISVGIWWLLFSVILNVTRGVDNVVGFLAVGVFAFHFTMRSVKAGTRSITSNEGLLRAISFPRAILPLSVVIAEVMTLGYALAAMFGVVLLTGETPAWTWLLIVPMFAIQFLFNTGLALFFARLADHFRDLTQIVPYGLRVWGMLSGVFMPITRRLEGYPELLTITEYNPAYLFMELPRRAILDNAGPTTRQWITVLVWSVVMLIVGFFFFLRRENEYGRG
ncbi:MAG: ABC transporter permease [Actinobacteria bacterium]|nr:ABC transporter permease [Actinomycetota bacterium]